MRSRSLWLACCFFFFKQKTAYEISTRDWSSDVCSSDLFCARTMARLPDTPKPEMMSVVLHEAAHNLGPAHEYKVHGKADAAAFGGPLSSTCEELKAQASALYFPDWLVKKGLIDQEAADVSRLRDVSWALGHV